MSKTKKQTIGAWGEQKAVQFLTEKGYNIIDRNFHTRMGEIDIIAWHKKIHFGNTLCFIEVKTRGHEDGSAERATIGGKFARIKQATIAYCIKNDIDREQTPIQFEQVSIYGSIECIKYIRHNEIILV